MELIRMICRSYKNRRTTNHEFISQLIKELIYNTENTPLLNRIANLLDEPDSGDGW